jgi:hypothetical protein
MRSAARSSASTVRGAKITPADTAAAMAGTTARYKTSIDAPLVHVQSLTCRNSGLKAIFSERGRRNGWREVVVDTIDPWC